jgi:hypothetical protein
MNTAHHVLETVTAPQDQVMRLAEAWFHENRFRILPPSGKPGLRAVRGSRLGILDRHTSRVMEISTKSVGDVTAVSVYHHTTRIFCITGIMFTDILRIETANFFSYLRAHCPESPNKSLQATAAAPASCD